MVFFRIASAIVGLQVFVDLKHPKSILFFSAIRYFAFVNISQESPGWHLLGFLFAIHFRILRGPLMPWPSADLDSK